MGRLGSLSVGLVLALTLAWSRRYICGAAFVSGQWAPTVPLSLPLTLAVLLLLSVTAARSLLRRRHPPPRLGLIDAAVVAWLLAPSLIALTLAEPPLFFCADLFPYLFATIVFMAARHGRRPVPIDGLVSLAALLVALSVVLDAEAMWPWPSMRRPGGVLGNRNYAAEYLALALPFVVVGCLRRARLARATLLVTAIAIALTHCRTAWIASAVAIACAIVVTAAPRAAKARVIGLAGAGVLLAMVLPTRLSWQTSTWSTAAHLVDVGSGSGQLRVAQYVETVRHVLATPLVGTGPGRWSDVVSVFAPALTINRNPHSDWLRALASGGLVGLLALLLFYVGALCSTWRLRREEPAWLAVVLAAVVIGSADSLLYRIETTAVVMMTIGLAAAQMGRRVAAQSEMEQPPAGAPRLGPEPPAGAADAAGIAS